ncbi:MAG: cobalt-precorrin-6A reductase [Rhodospirillaceae bacterium TMED8]|nr:cobalt-precorrin-6A reductase [Magnetovibrio sp.]OUT47795.1 MAG: cobalt-precorrin-6A reductase [Rhodospirillaceae bacterium TMED8]
MKRLLILGGTSEARLLADRIVDRFSRRVDVTTSWAGRTARYPDVSGKVRVGGFGGVDGLRGYLRQNKIDLLVDATHPFAQKISAHASEAARQMNTPKLNLLRENWNLPASEYLYLTEDLNEAAEILKQISKRTFLTTGSQTVSAFSSIGSIWFLVRLVDPPTNKLPLKYYDLTIGRPPFDDAHERKLFEIHNIDTLVSKASGGRVPEKILVAQRIGCPIILITPPSISEGDSTTSIEDVIAWIAHQV